MIHSYFSTFISGFSDVIKDVILKREKLKIRLILDGLIVYERDTKVEKIKKLPFFNNSFFVIHYAFKQKNNDLNSFISDSEKFIQKSSITPEILIGKKSFRIIISKENELQHIAPLKLRQLEDLFSQKLRLEVDRANPDLEVWFLERNEGYSFCGIRLTKKPSTDKYLQKGELRPELAWLLNFLSEPKATDVFLDPFAGHGSIPQARIQFPFNKIIASDINEELIKPNANIEIHHWDATKLPLEDNSIDKIVTDPPWGSFEQINVEQFYPKMLDEFGRIVKPDGIVVLLTAQKELLEKLIEENKIFKLESRYNILVSGKKSGVYKLQKLG
jgi:tRNA G10  N-methylase Trm11